MDSTDFQLCFRRQKFLVNLFFFLAKDGPEIEEGRHGLATHKRYRLPSCCAPEQGCVCCGMEEVAH